MDKLDLDLLGDLMKNSRISLTQLSKKLRVSREVVTYRLNKLKEQKIILDLITEIDLDKMGYVGAAVFVNVKATKQAEFKEFLAKASFVSWVAELSGIWSFGFSIIGNSNEELDTKFSLIYNVFKEAIIDHRFVLHRKSTFFYEKFFNIFPEKINRNSSNYKIDAKDKIILRELSENSRIESVALSNKVGLTAPAITQRITRLKKSGYIKKYTAFIDISKLQLFQYSIFITNKNIDEQKKLIYYLAQHKNISFIAEYIGDPFLEFGMFVNDPYKLRGVLQKIEEDFPNNRLFELSLFNKEFVSVGTPKCVFE